MEEGSQEEARKRNEGRKKIMRKKATKAGRKMRSLKKELEALGGWPWKDKTPYKDGTARRLRMKMKRNAGKKATKWQNKWERSDTWKIQLS